MIEIGIDVGGTFTDAIIVDSHKGAVIDAFKLPSTPDDPGRAVLAALRRISADHDLSKSQVSHGTTIGTNTLIERRGARTALVTTAGFTDVLELRRQDRPRTLSLGCSGKQTIGPVRSALRGTGTVGP
ncbi:MAG: hypothetical protein M5U35_05380 [Roseovarius sp.]|nr:hypothetical protein [Roseovarius sp.]